MFFSNASGQPFKGCGSVMPNALFTLRLICDLEHFQQLTVDYWHLLEVIFKKKTITHPPTHSLGHLLFLHFTF